MDINEIEMDNPVITQNNTGLPCTFTYLSALKTAAVPNVCQTDFRPAAFYEPYYFCHYNLILIGRGRLWI